MNFLINNKKYYIFNRKSFHYQNYTFENNIIVLYYYFINDIYHFFSFNSSFFLM